MNGVWFAAEFSSSPAERRQRHLQDASNNFSITTFPHFAYSQRYFFLVLKLHALVVKNTNGIIY